MQLSLTSKTEISAKIVNGFYFCKKFILDVSLGFKYGSVSSLIKIGLRMPFVVECKPFVSPETKLRTVTAFYTMEKMY